MRRAQRRRLRPLPPLPRGHRPAGRARVRQLPLLDRVEPHRARGGPVLHRRPRPLPAHVRGLPRARPRATVTFHHFTTPRWATADGGWADPAIVDRFVRFCEKATGHLGDLITRACTINEPEHGELRRLQMRRVPARRRRPRAAGWRPATTSSPPTGGPTRCSRPARATSRSGSRCRWSDYQAVPADDPEAPATARARSAATPRTSSSRRAGATTSSACRPTAARRVGPDGMLGPRTASTCWRWATSTGPRRWRRRSAGRGRSPSTCRSSSPRTASAPTTTRSASATSRPRSDGVLDCIDEGIDVRGYTYWSAWTTSSGPSATGPASASSTSTAPPSSAWSSPPATGWAPSPGPTSSTTDVRSGCRPGSAPAARRRRSSSRSTVRVRARHRVVRAAERDAGVVALEHPRRRSRAARSPRPYRLDCSGDIAARAAPSPPPSPARRSGRRTTPAHSELMSPAVE